MGTLATNPDPQAANPDPLNAIRALNDGLRQRFRDGRVVLTAGVAALPDVQLNQVIRAVRAFDGFDTENDPHGEHDFGVIKVAGTRCFWKIDYYNQGLAGHSPNPADPSVTVRVLTIMLAEEY
jgi:hypothetical protein